MRRFLKFQKLFMKTIKTYVVHNYIMSVLLSSLFKLDIFILRSKFECHIKTPNLLHDMYCL